METRSAEKTGLGQERHLLVNPRVKHFCANKKREIVDTDEEENLVAPSIERSIVVAVELQYARR